MDRIKIVVLTGDKNYIYNGNLISDSEGWITIDDDKDGLIKLNKQQIISIKVLGDSR